MLRINIHRLLQFLWVIIENSGNFLYSNQPRVQITSVVNLYKLN